MRNCYKGEYDRVISLGMDCRPKVIMDITGLSGKRTALDVVATQQIDNLIYVLNNRFTDWFLESNLYTQPNSDKQYKRVRDIHTNYISVHDFSPESESISSDYPTFKSRLDKHADTLLKDIRNNDRVLFILNLEMSPHERDTTDDLDTLTRQLPALRQLLDQMCGNTNSHLFIATYHEPLQSLHLSRTHIAIKQPYWKTFMRGEELQTWQKWLDGVWLSQKYTYQA